MAYAYVCTKIIDGFITDMEDALNTFVKLVTPHIMEINLCDILKEDNEHE